MLIMLTHFITDNIHCPTHMCTVCHIGTDGLEYLLKMIVKDTAKLLSYVVYMVHNITVDV